MAAAAVLVPAIPLQGKEKEADTASVETPLPEPAQLYCRVVIALLLHVPNQPDSRCNACGAEWPCDQMKLACFLIEVF